MKTILALLLFLTIARADNTLTLTWSQPPGYSSTLYTATNPAGQWVELSTNTPPYVTQTTNAVAFFTVIVCPQTQFAGCDNPTMPAQPGSTYVNTNTCDFWINQTGGSDGWVWEISGQ